MAKSAWTKVTELRPKDGDELIVLVDVDGMIQPHYLRYRERYSKDREFRYGSYPVVAYCKVPSYEEFKR